MNNIPILEASMGDITSQIPVIGFFIIYIAVLSVMIFSTNTIFAVLVALLGVLYFYFFGSQAYRNIRR